MADWPPKYGTDAYDQLVEDTAKVLERHVGGIGERGVWRAAWRLVGAYETFLDDQWSRSRVQTDLERFEDALDELVEAQAKIPDAIWQALQLDASHLDWSAPTRFLDQTKKDLIFESEIAAGTAEETVKAISTAVAGAQDLKFALRHLNKRLPAGVQTRNRPLADWAVVEAAAELCRADNLINVPDSLGEESPFYRLLAGLFPVFRARNAPVGTFRGWKKYIDTNRENLDLLEI